MNKLRLLMAVIGLSVLMVGCSASGKFKRSYNGSGIPADLKKEGYVLLVVKADAGYRIKKNNQKVAQYFRKYYKAPYEIINYNDLKSEKYANTDKYRYAILRDFGKGMEVTRASTSGRMSASTYYADYFKDRKNDIDLPSLGYHTIHYAQGIEGFLKYLKKQ